MKELGDGGVLGRGGHRVKTSPWNEGGAAEYDVA